MKISFMVIAISLILTGCQDVKTISGFGRNYIKCFSGGKIIYEGVSAEDISQMAYGHGWELKDSKTGKSIKVTGDCLVEAGA